MNQNKLVEALKNVCSLCDSQNQSHEAIWCVANDALVKHNDQQSNSNQNKLIEALQKIVDIDCDSPAMYCVNIAQQALSEHAANKEDKWKELEDWVEDNFSKTNDYGTTLNATGERIIDKIKSIKN